MVSPLIACLPQINLLAFDFDQTLVDVHTFGRWQDSEAELAKHVRPFFRELVLAGAEHGMHMAVVTFSAQVSIIRGVLHEAFGEEIASRIVIRGADGSWTYTGRGACEGKQAHIASAAEELTQFTRCSTLLFDDDEHNVRAALDAGVRAVLCDTHDPHAMVRDLIALS
ncbi:hypothetical protein JKP88DRAFT_168258 [Tribonema minus]|uniref:Uncharacterized protein n=1 Tax=Tribonema minus TaxID=303371 RepID=A0A835YYJ4_9STRA|nr:hypothetical protein JKP88DRAFT_168258 [Tribonema minus]